MNRIEMEKVINDIEGMAAWISIYEEYSHVAGTGVKGEAFALDLLSSRLYDCADNLWEHLNSNDFK